MLQFGCIIDRTRASTGTQFQVIDLTVRLLSDSVCLLRVQPSQWTRSVKTSYQNSHAGQRGPTTSSVCAKCGTCQVKFVAACLRVYFSIASRDHTSHNEYFLCRQPFARNCHSLSNRSARLVGARFAIRQVIENCCCSPVSLHSHRCFDCHACISDNERFC